MLKKFFKDIFNRGNFKDYFKRNKVFLSFATILLVLSLLSGFYSYSSYTEIATSMMGEVASVASSDYTVTDNMMVLFANNFFSNIYVMGMGLLFSIPSIIITVLNGVLVGYVFSTRDFFRTFVSVAPHGIFELIALVFSLAGAFLVTKMEIRLLSGILSRKDMGDIILRLKVPFKDLILSVSIVLVLLVVGAIIEAKLTPVLMSSFGI